jgi:hypothetical protein
MRKLYCVPECETCDELKEWIKDQSDSSINEIVELKKVEGEWHEKTEDGYIKFDKNVKAFPALLVGKYGDNQNVYIVGKEGIQSFLSKNYIYEQKKCPYLNGPCIEKECGKFVIMNKGPIQEGGCGDYWTPILLTEILIKEK